MCSWLRGDDSSNSFAVYGKEVDVIANNRDTGSPGSFSGVKSPAPSSNKVKMKQVKILLSSNKSMFPRNLQDGTIHSHTTERSKFKVAFDFGEKHRDTG